MHGNKWPRRDRPQTSALESWFGIASGSTFLWFLFGPLWSVAFFRREESQ
jgi:hypothetical protein